MDPNPPNRFHRIGWALRMVREHHGLTQQVVADRAGWPRTRLSDWENDRHPPTLHNLGLLAAAIGFDLAELDHALAIVQQRTTRPLPPLPEKPAPREVREVLPTAEELTRQVLGTRWEVPSTEELVLLPHAEAFLSLAAYLRREDEKLRAAACAPEELPTF